MNDFRIGPLDFGVEEFVEDLESDAEEYDEQGLAPMEDTPSTLRTHATELVQIDNLAEEIDLNEEQMDPGPMNEDDAREAGYLDAEADR
jgi:hypothetical protein